MKKSKQYYNIKEVSHILNLKEHVIRHWDSIDPKTNKLRIDGLSIRTKGGTRYFNQNHIKKLLNIKNILFEEGKHNYSLDLVKKIISSKKLEKTIHDDLEVISTHKNSPKDDNIKLKKIINNLKSLIS
ncbi:MerR family transcriptional regulator [Pelagibacteraceae bacterium]|nr:MerR family transcriptional regulator [Pelagibacteraceae bacterium]